MSDWVNELNERSKDDRAIIVGSEVRTLCGEIARLRAALAEAEAMVIKTRTDSARAVESIIEKWQAVIAQRNAALARAESAEMTKAEALAAEAKAQDAEDAAEASLAQALEVLQGLVAWCEQGAWEGEDGSPDALNAARRALASALGRGEGGGT